MILAEYGSIREVQHYFICLQENFFNLSSMDSVVLNSSSSHDGKYPVNVIGSQFILIVIIGALASLARGSFAMYSLTNLKNTFRALEWMSNKYGNILYKCFTRLFLAMLKFINDGWFLKKTIPYPSIIPYKIVPFLNVQCTIYYDRLATLQYIL